MSKELFADQGRHPQGYVAEAYDILCRAVEKYKPSHVFAMFSGGHDSLCSTALASHLDGFTAAVHINTGIGIERTRQFVRDTCAEHAWRLLEYHPPPFRCAPAKRRPGVDYENLPCYDAMVLHYGFPGSGGHPVAYNRLKERCLRQLTREHKRGRRDRIMLVGGMRTTESVRRMGNAREMSLDGCRAWVAPIVHWTDRDKDAYIAANALKRNPIVGALCMSGECLCGAFARPGEIKEIEAVDPAAAARIHALELRAREGGVHCVWGTRHPNSQPEKDRRDAPGQLALFGLCSSCHARHEAEEDGHRLEAAGARPVLGEEVVRWQLPGGAIVSFEEADRWLSQQ